MASTISQSHLSTFQKALDDFKSDLSQEEQDEITYTTLPALQKCIRSIQDDHWKARNSKNMDRLRHFLEGMEQYSKVIEVFMNTSAILCFVWGPMKFLLQISSNHMNALDGLLEIYKELGESLPIVEHYANQLQNKSLPHLQQMLECIFSDILKFHHTAYKFFKQKAWKQLFAATWRTYSSRFQTIINDIKRRKELIESGANAVQFQMLEKCLAIAEVDSQRQREIHDRERMSFVRDWLAAAPVQEDHEENQRVRNAHAGSCEWVLGTARFQTWEDSGSGSPLLWIHGIPGAGKSTLASFIIDHLEQKLSTVLYFYCKSHDQSRNSFQAVLRALIDQSITKDPAALQYLLDQVSTSGERPLRTLKRSQEILETCLKNLKGAYIIIDGVDECSSVDKKAIATFFKSSIRSLQDEGVDVRCIFSCQSDEDTARLFRGIPALDIVGDGLKEDIKNFCDIESEVVKHKFMLTDVEKENIAKKVFVEAAGMFLYAKLVMKNLQDQSKLVHLRNELLPGVFPKGLQKAYERIANRILDSQSARYDDTLQLLSLMLCSKRTLKWFEVQGAVAIDLEVRNVDYDGRMFRVDAKELCGSLVEVRQSGNVELVHATARSFLVESGFINAVTAELNLCRLCIRYLSFPCFAIEPHRKEIGKLVEDGYYIFANYALVYWTDHLTTVVAFESSVVDSEKRMLLQDIQELLTTQYDPRHMKTKLSTDKIKNEFSVWNREAFFEKLIEAIAVHRLRRRSDQELLKSHKDLPLLRSNMRMEENFLEVRREIRRARNLAGKYGNDLYQCSQLGCHRFSEGFSDPQLHHDHENKHYTMKCPVEGCIAMFRGPGMYGSLNQHIEHIHDRSHDTFHPIGQPKTWASKLKELVQYVDVHGLEECLSIAKHECHGTVTPYKLFQEERDSNDWASKQIWKLAVANPIEELLQVLIKYTDFKGTYAQGWILEQATLAGDQGLVERFTHSKYDNGRESRFHPAWDRAVKAAMTSGHAEILGVLLDRAKLNDRERPSEEKIRGLCITAARSGHLPCVELLVARHDANPYHAKRGVKMNEDLREAPSGRLEREKFQHSAFYYAALNGDNNMVKHLTERASDGQLASLFRKESREDFMLLAAANGYEEIISILDTQSIQRKFIDDALLRARFYNAIQQGNRAKAEEMVEQSGAMKEMQDRNGCTLLIHAAFHGFESVVRALIKGGADILHGVYRYGDVRFYPEKFAAEIAMESGHIRVAQILKSQMRDEREKVKKRKKELMQLELMQIELMKTQEERSQKRQKFTS